MGDCNEAMSSRLQTQQGVHELIATVKQAQPQAKTNSSAEDGGEREVSPPADESLAVDSFWEREPVFFASW